MNENNKMKDTTIKIMAGIGVIAVLSIGGLLTVTIMSKLPAVLSNLTAQVVNVTQRFIPAEKIVVTLDNENPLNGNLVNLSFGHLSKEEDGLYSFFYECREGVHFEKAFSGETNNIIFCNTPYNFLNSNNTFSFFVFSTKPNVVEVPLSINFVRNNSTRISERGEAKIRINGSTGTTQDGGTILLTDNRNNIPTTVSRTPGDRVEETFLFNETTDTTKGISDPNGRIDLKSTILAVGRIDRISNVFTATSSIPTSDRGAVRFEIENIGTKASGPWTFNVVVPTFPAFIYHSKSQQSLLPGDKIEYTIGFDSIRSDNKPNTIVVNADPISSINELDETNNIVKAELPAYTTN